MDFDENDKESEADKRERERLYQSTFEQSMIGPKGLQSDTNFDLSEWRRYVRQYRIAIVPFVDICVLCWCRIYLSVTRVTPDTILVHYNFENLYDGDIALSVNARLLSRKFSQIERFWLVEDMTSGTKNQYKRSDIEGEPLELTGVWVVGRVMSPSVPVLYVGPSEILTITQKARRNADGSWYLCNFGKCLPGHTYKFQLIYGGLPSNVFTWTAPD